MLATGVQRIIRSAPEIASASSSVTSSATPVPGIHSRFPVAERAITRLAKPRSFAAKRANRLGAGSDDRELSDSRIKPAMPFRVEQVGKSHKVAA